MYSLIVVDFNSITKTVEYIESCKIAMGKEGASHVVVVQNGDPKDDIGVLIETFGQPQERQVSATEKKILIFQKDFQTVAYCAANENLGYAKGNNFAVKIAAELWDDPYYIISNNDLEFPKGFNLQIANELFCNYSDIGIIGPQVITPQGEAQSPRRWIGAGQKLIGAYWLSMLSKIFGSRFRSAVFDKYGRDIVFGAKSGYYAWVSGCFMIVRATSFCKAGMFDENTFLYAEEPILAKRLERVHSKVFFCDELTVIHAHGATTKSHLRMAEIHKIDFSSNYYMYKEYMHTSPILLFCSKVNIRVFLFLLVLKAKLLGRK